MSDKTISTPDKLKRVWKALDSNHVVMLTTVGARGLHGRPMALHADRAANALYFITDMEGAKDEEIAKNPDVSVAIMDGNFHLALTGHAQISNDTAKLKEIWSTYADAWFPDGPDSPRSRLLVVTPDLAEYWDGDNSLVSGVKLAVSLATNERPDLGDNETVQMRAS